jgi:hypothetical protein
VPSPRSIVQPKRDEDKYDGRQHSGPTQDDSAFRFWSRPTYPTSAMSPHPYNVAATPTSHEFYSNDGSDASNDADDPLTGQELHGPPLQTSPSAAGKVKYNKINADVNFTLPCLTPTRNYAVAALLLLKTITTNADMIKWWAILDLGATSHFLTTSAPATNILPNPVPIIARLPNGNQVHSTHTHMLNIPLLPPNACAAHIIPDLASHLLLSIVTMCNAGCTVTFSKISCTIVYRGRTIVCGHKCLRTGLWMIPLAENTTPPTTMPTTSPISIELAANVDATSSATEYA